MKSHLTKVSLALLSAAFLLGCQEQGSELVGPDGLGPEFASKKCQTDPNHKSCKDGDLRQVLAEVTMKGGMLIPLADPQTVQLNDAGSSMVFQTGNNTPEGVTLAMNLTETSGIDFPTKCEQLGKGLAEGNPAGLFAMLDGDPLPSGRIQVTWDTQEATSDLNQILVRRDWVDGFGTVRIILGTHSEFLDKQMTVTVGAGNLEDGLTVTFSGGSVKVFVQPGRSAKTHYSIQCPVSSKDEIIMTVQLQ